MADEKTINGKVRNLIDKIDLTGKHFIIAPGADLDDSLKEKIGQNILTDSTDLNVTSSIDEMVVVVNLSDVPSESGYASGDFHTMIDRGYFSESPYHLLRFARNHLSVLGKATFIDASNGDIDKRKAEKILRCAGFNEVMFEGDDKSPLIKASKRMPVRYVFGSGKYTLTEIVTEDDINRAMSFAKRYYGEKFNFEIDIDKQFSLHSDIFVVHESGNCENILGMLRYCWLVPGKYLPCMLAVERQTGEHIRLPIDPRLNIGEVYAIWDRSLGIEVGFKQVYKELIRTNVLAMRNIEDTDFMFTTFEVNDKGSAALYKGNYRMKEVGAVLKYGSFGGEWVLINFGKDAIESLYQNPDVIFQRKK